MRAHVARLKLVVCTFTTVALLAACGTDGLSELPDPPTETTPVSEGEPEPKPETDDVREDAVNLRVLAPRAITDTVTVVFTGQVNDGYGLEAWDRAGRTEEIVAAPGDRIEVLGVELEIVGAEISEVDSDIEDGGDPSNMTVQVLAIDETFGTEIGADRMRQLSENQSAQAGEYWLDIGECDEETFTLFAQSPSGADDYETEVRAGDIVELFDLELRVTEYVPSNPEADGLTTVEIEIL